MNLYLLRHGQTDWNVAHRIIGRTDVELNELGITQAQNAREELKNLQFDICFSSPLKRAKMTADIVCEGRCPVVEDDLLKERAMGIKEGRIFDPTEPFIEHESIETDEHILWRAQEFINKMRESGYKNVLVVSHSGLLKHIRHLIVHDANTPVDYNEWRPGNCECTKFEIS